MTMVDKAKALDVKIEAAGGLGPFWIADQKGRRERGETYYTHLIDPATDEVVAEFKD